MGSLRGKLLVLFIVLSTLSGGLVGGILYSQYSSYAQSKLRETLEQTAAYVAGTIPYSGFEEYENAVDTPQMRNYREMIGRYADALGTSFIYLYARKPDGRVITVELSMIIPEEPVIEWEGPAAAALETLDKGTVGSAEYSDEFGDFLSLFTPLSSAGGYPAAIGVDIEQSIVGQVRRKALTGFLLALLCGGLLSALFSLLVAYRITKPLIRLGGELRNLAESDADLTVRIDEGSQDEIGRLAHSFNRFVSRLLLLMQDVKGAVDGTDQIRFNITGSSEETSTAVEQISANLRAIGDQIGLLDRSINETVASIEQISRSIDSMDGQIITQSAMVEESTASVTQMMASLGSVSTVVGQKKGTTATLSRVAAEGMGKLEETARNFQTVVHSINEVHEMTSAINNIASQTNLLSMNAAIEAAHAGESGKGFAVVAEEIRKLADNSGSTAASISRVIETITASIVGTEEDVAAMKRNFSLVLSEVESTINAFSEIEHAIGELNTGGEQILQSTVEINRITSHIRSGSGEIKSGTDSMIGTSDTIRQVSKQVALGMDESNSGIGEIVLSMQNMVELAGQLSEIVRLLKENFGRFRTE